MTWAPLELSFKLIGALNAIWLGKAAHEAGAPSLKAAAPSQVFSACEPLKGVAEQEQGVNA